MKNLLKILLVCEEEELIKPDDNFQDSNYFLRDFPWKELLVTIGFITIVGFFILTPWVIGMIELIKLLF